MNDEESAEAAEAREAAERYGSYIPDKLLLRDAKHRLIAVYNPAWYRLDRHVFWLFKRLLGSGMRGHATFSALVVNRDDTQQLVVFSLPVYEVAEQ